MPKIALSGAEKACAQLLNTPGDHDMVEKEVLLVFNFIKIMAVCASYVYIYAVQPRTCRPRVHHNMMATGSVGWRR